MNTTTLNTNNQQNARTDHSTEVHILKQYYYDCLLIPNII